MNVFIFGVAFHNMKRDINDFIKFIDNDFRRSYDQEDNFSFRLTIKII